MGLDSIELLMEIEKYFGIEVPGPEAEKILTVQNMVDCVAAHLNVFDESMALRDRIFSNIRDTLQQSGLSDKPIELTDHIFKFIYPANKKVWQDFEQRLGLRVDAPYIVPGNNKLVDKIKSLLWSQPLYDWADITADQFTTVVCAGNYDRLIDQKNIRSKYEIYIAIAAITVDKIGVEYYEIAPGKSFTNDLGVD